MKPISPGLAQWLDEILSDDENNRRQIWDFPNQELYEEYLTVAGDRPNDEIRDVIRRLLIPSGAIGYDRIIYQTYLGMREKEFNDEDMAQWRMAWINSDYVQRVARYYGGKTKNPPWEGITWVLNLLPDHPRQALNALEAYFLANMAGLTDTMINGLGDVEGIIRARYIGLPESSSGRLAILDEISWRQFEQLVEHLYAEKGYKTELTQATRDGGCDIIADLSGPALQERILVSCKRSKNKIGVSAVRDLDSVATRALANKGTLVTNSDFTRDVRSEFAGNSRIELINGSELIVLLNEHLGWTWPARIEYFSRERPLGATVRKQGDGVPRQ